MCKRIFINDNQDESNLYLDDITPAPAQVLGQLQEAEDEVLLVQSPDIIGRLRSSHLDGRAEVEKHQIITSRGREVG
jgi:hypothetical protein